MTLWYLVQSFRRKLNLTYKILLKVVVKKSSWTVRPNPEDRINRKPKDVIGWITEEQELANTFNNFFVDKVEKLKDNINPNMVKDPLEKLKAKLEGKNLKFSLKPVTEKIVKKAMDKMKRKKSSGKDNQL